MAQKRSSRPALRAFGAKLRELRGERSREQISARLEYLGITLDESTLVQYEKGTVWSPDAGVLWGLAVIYNQPLTELVGLLLLNRQNVDATAEDADTLLANVRAAAGSEQMQRLLGTRLPQEPTRKRVEVGRPIAAENALAKEERRALRLLRLMSGAGHRQALGILASVAKAFPKPPGQQSAEKHGRTAGARDRRGHGTR